MSSRPTDPLLLAGRILTFIMQGIMALAALALAIGMPVILFMEDRIDAEIAAETATTVSSFPTMSVLGLMLIGLTVVGLVFVFFGKLRRIIETVEEGDPFVPDNADRLTLMAWMMLGVQLLMIPAAALGLLVSTWAEQIEDANVNFEAGLDVTAITLVIVLFILARVFRQGAEMRDDLEGTV